MLNADATAPDGTSLPLVEVDDENSPLLPSSLQDNTTWNLTDYHAPVWRAGSTIFDSASVDSDLSSAKGVAGGYAFTAMDTVVTVGGSTATGLRAHSGHIILAGVAADASGSATDPDLNKNNVQVSKVTVALADVLDTTFNPYDQNLVRDLPKNDGETDEAYAARIAAEQEKRAYGMYAYLANKDNILRQLRRDNPKGDCWRQTKSMPLASRRPSLPPTMPSWPTARPPGPSTPHPST